MSKFRLFRDFLVNRAIDEVPIATPCFSPPERTLGFLSKKWCRLSDLNTRPQHSSHYNFSCHPIRNVCGLDFPFILSAEANLDAHRQVSTPLPLGALARDCHFKGFPDFDECSPKGFPMGTQFIITNAMLYQLS